MAATSKETKAFLVAKSFKERLDSLECPYTSDVEESWISQVLLKPGETRIQILHWLFSKFDPETSEILDVHHAPIEFQLDSRQQRLLQVASTLGLCSPDDIDLVKGVTTGPKQWGFLDQLIDMVIIAEAAEDAQSKPLNPPGVVCDSSSLQHQFTLDCMYVDRLVSEERMDTLFHPVVSLLPPDIAHKVERNWVKQGFTKDKPPLPNFKQLSDSYSELMDQLSRQREILQELIEEFSDKDEDRLDHTTTSKTLALVLKELSQFITGFMYSFENDIRPWCNKPRPNFVPLGPAIKRVHNLLTGLKQFQSGLRSSQLSHKALNEGCKMKNVEKRILQGVGKSTSAAHKFQAYVTILEDSAARLGVAAESGDNPASLPVLSKSQMVE